MRQSAAAIVMPTCRGVGRDGQRGALAPAHEPLSCLPRDTREGAAMNSLIYLVGLLVVILAVLTFFGVV